MSASETQENTLLDLKRMCKEELRGFLEAGGGQCSEDAVHEFIIETADAAVPAGTAELFRLAADDMSICFREVEATHDRTPWAYLAAAVFEELREVMWDAYEEAKESAEA